MPACRSQQNVNLNESELTAAMKLLDKRGSGYVEFDEFVDWWVNKVCLLLCYLHGRVHLLHKHCSDWRHHVHCQFDS